MKMISLNLFYVEVKMKIRIKLFTHFREKIRHNFSFLIFELKSEILKIPIIYVKTLKKDLQGLRDSLFKRQSSFWL